MTSLILLFLLILLIILSGFLSGSETAITATSKARILYKKKKGSKRAGYVLELLDKKDNVISTLLLSNNLVNILASSLATAFFYDLFGVEGIFYATLIMTVVIVIFAEVLPKTYAINRPNRTALLISPIIYYLNKILFIFVFVINLIVRLIFRKNENDIINNDLQSEEELKGVIDLYKTSSPDYEQEKDMLQSILQLNDITVEEIFTHRKNMTRPFPHWAKFRCGQNLHGLQRPPTSSEQASSTRGITNRRWCRLPARSNKNLVGPKVTSRWCY